MTTTDSPEDWNKVPLQSGSCIGPKPRNHMLTARAHLCLLKTPDQ